jgi:hypothetical protein
VQHDYVKRFETKTDCATRTEVLKHIADCFMEACDTAAFLDNKDKYNALVEITKLRREIEYYGMYMNTKVKSITSQQ